MEFIKPKNLNAEKVDWMISERTRAIVKYYAEYADYSEGEVVDMFLQNLLEDGEFRNWIEKKRNNRRMLRQLEMEGILKENALG